MEGKNWCSLFVGTVILILIFCALRNSRREEQSKALQEKFKNYDDFVSMLRKVINETQADKSPMGIKKQMISENQREIAATSCISYADSVGIQTIKLPYFKAFQVFCDNGWTVIQQRINDNSNVDLNSVSNNEFIDSFEVDYFLGLQKIRRLTKTQPHELYISLDFLNGTRKIAHYDNFEIDSINSDGYMLVNLGAMTGNFTNDILRNFENATYFGENCEGDVNCLEYLLRGWCKFNSKTYKDVKKDKMLMRPKDVQF